MHVVESLSAWVRHLLYHDLSDWPRPTERCPALPTLTLLRSGEFDRVLTLTLIHPASNWTHWATLRRHPCLSSLELPPLLPPSWASSFVEVSVDWAPPVRSWSTWSSPVSWYLPVQRLLWYALVIHSHHMSKPAKSSFSQYVVHGLLSSSSSDLHVCYPVFPRDPQYAMLLCHLWWAASSLFVNVPVNGHTSAPYRRVDRIIASYHLVFTITLILLFLQIFFILPNTAAAFPISSRASQIHLHQKLIMRENIVLFVISS